MTPRKSTDDGKITGAMSGTLGELSNQGELHSHNFLPAHTYKLPVWCFTPYTLYATVTASI